MRDGNNQSGGSDAELDRIDGLISAAMDEELQDERNEGTEEGVAESRAELQRLVAEDESIAARARAFEQVDAALRALASDSDQDERLAANLDALKARLELRGGEEDERRGEEMSEGAASKSENLVWLRRRTLPVLVAAAAALALYVGLSASGPSTFEQDDRAVSDPWVAESAKAQPSLPSGGQEESLEREESLEFGDELVWVLGYVEDTGGSESISSDLIEDLEIIEQLEILDFLSSREAASDEPEGRG